MASALSHPAVALGFSRWFPASPAAVATGAVLSVLPDVDSLGFLLGIPYGAPLGHRGLTHSIAFAALSGAAGLALLRGKRSTAIFAYLFLCAVSHGILDGMTNGGLGVAYFAPFSNERYFLPWRPLRVSPVSISAFFSPWGLRVLESEIPWIWFPCALVAAAAFLRRRS